jgi:3-phenylpropionate/trans-cinnamate dioxygenase ferredoxin subunit
MAFIEVGKVADCAPGTLRAVTAEGKQILLVNAGGMIYALGRRCTHLGGDLSQGKLTGATVTCPRHGSVFDVATGKALSGPRIGPLKLNTKDQVTYKVKIEGEAILVDIP